MIAYIFTRIGKKGGQNVILSAFKNEYKISAKTKLEVNGECRIISTFKENEEKNIKDNKIKGTISMISRNEK